jgi:hypothetical protein
VDGGSLSFGSFGQELFDGLVSVVVLTDFLQVGKMDSIPASISLAGMS